MLKGYTGVETINNTVFTAHWSKTTHSVRQLAGITVTIEYLSRFQRQTKVQTAFLNDVEQKKDLSIHPGGYSYCLWRQTIPKDFSGCE